MNHRLEVICSPHMGYCFGVKRAMSMIEEGINSNGPRIYSIGEVIHNPQAVERLRARGVTTVSGIDRIEPGSALVIRAHGVQPEIKEEAARKGIRLIDTTCPFVGKIHEYVARISKEGRRVIIIGDPNHPEVKGIAGSVEDTPVILESKGQIHRIEGIEAAGVVIQTTFSRDKAMGMIDLLRERIPDLQVYDTICMATILRRQATIELAGKVDMILVVGGRGSSNTKRLYEMCLEKGIKAKFIETADEIDPDWFGRCAKVGVTTGTSTPDWIIDEVLARLGRI